MFFFALQTGMRIGEVLGLRWEDWDEVNRVVYVRRTLLGVEKGGTPVFGPTKTGKPRKVPVGEQTAEVLRRVRLQQKEGRLKAGGQWQETGLVFTTPLGRPLRDEFVYRLLRKTAARAGVKPISLHGLRHTHATFLLRQGVHPKIVAERLGHTKVGITLDTYSHLLPDTQALAVTAIERAVPLAMR